MFTAPTILYSKYCLSRLWRVFSKYSSVDLWRVQRPMPEQNACMDEILCKLKHRNKSIGRSKDELFLKGETESPSDYTATGSVAASQKLWHDVKALATRQTQQRNEQVLNSKRLLFIRPRQFAGNKLPWHKCKHEDPTVLILWALQFLHPWVSTGINSR